MANCKQSVHSGRFGFYPCQRSPGFGPDSAYCKQHARLHEKPEAKAVVWKAPSKYSSGELPVAQKCREVGEKTFIDEHGRRNTMRNNYKRFFASELEALNYCLTRAQTNLNGARHEVEAEQKQVTLFKDAISKVKP